MDDYKIYPKHCMNSLKVVNDVFKAADSSTALVDALMGEDKEVLADFILSFTSWVAVNNSPGEFNEANVARVAGHMFQLYERDTLIALDYLLKGEM